jgi:hypothetical protein
MQLFNFILVMIAFENWNTKYHSILKFSPPETKYSHTLKYTFLEI